MPYLCVTKFYSASFDNVAEISTKMEGLVWVSSFNAETGSEYGMRLMLLLTGGTIGSVMQDNVLDVGGNPADKLLECLENRRKSIATEIICKRVMHVLSENMRFSHWMKLYKAVEETLEGNWDGILMTHGTDTLSYTAIFLSMMYAYAKIPIFLISSQLSLDDPQADGYDNFVAAVDFIKNVKVGGVFVPTTVNGDDGSKSTTIHLGSRLTQALGFTHRFQSVGDISFGKMVNGCFERNPSAYNPEIWQLQQGEEMTAESQSQFDTVLERYTIAATVKSPTASASLANTLCKQQLAINKNQQPRHILYLKAVPGLDLSLFDWKIKPAAILVELYHSGTACTGRKDASYSMITFSRKCREQGIDLYGVSLDTRKALYQSTRDMQEADIRVLSDISPEAAYVKLCIAYRAFEEQENRDQFLDENVAFEKLIEIKSNTMTTY
jgi:L-asparaginase